MLLVTLTLFEVDMRSTAGKIAPPTSPYFGTIERPGPVSVNDVSEAARPRGSAGLGLHVAGHPFVLRRHHEPAVDLGHCAGLAPFPKPPAPNEHSPSHKLWAWIAAIDMGMTALTGWIFYVLAFVA